MLYLIARDALLLLTTRTIGEQQAESPMLKSLPELGDWGVELSRHAKRVARFGLYEVDLNEGVLTKNGLRVKLQGQPFQVLALLIENPGQVVSRDEIRRQLWSADTYVEFDDGLNTAIKKLRLALNDSADNPRFIETVPRKGYRFLAPVDFAALVSPAPASSGATLIVPPTDAGQIIVATRERVVLEQTIPQRRWLWGSIVGALLLLVVGLYVVRARSRAYPTILTEKDAIVLADFFNSTGESVFDGTLKQALSVELGQSPFLNVASDLRVSDTLRQMGRSSEVALAPELAREVCLRMGSRAIMVGSIASLGSHYLVGLEALGCASGETLAKGQAEAMNKEGVLKALNEVASQMRSKVGESLSSLEKYDFPVDTTTKSLEALKAYSMAAKIVREKGEAESIPFLQRAIQLDPDFALAYSALGTRYDNLGEDALATTNVAKAYSLRDRVSERERYHITAMYHSDVTGDLEKEKGVCELWAQVFPHDTDPRELLGVVYATAGEREKALAAFQDVLRLAPESAINHGNVAVASIALDQLETARSALNGAQARGLDGIIIHENLYSIAFLQGDTAEMERQVAWATGKSGVEDQLLAQHSDTAAYDGRLRNARELSRRAVESALRGEAKETAAMWTMNGAMREVEVGNVALAQRAASSALSLAPTRDVKTLAALVLVETGDVSRAQALIHQLESGNQSNTILRAYWLPTLKASLEIRAGNPQAALSLLQVAAPYEMGEAAYISNMYPAYIRGRAYLMAHNGAAAASEFSKLLEHRGIVQNDILGALSRLQLARAQAMAGDREKARKQYEDFLSLWKGADDDIPILKDAQAEYAKLQ